MSRISWVVGAFLVAGVASMATAETVYKWIDSKGQVHYTDLPPRQGDAKVLGVYQQESGTADDQGDDNGNYAEEGDGEESGEQTAAQTKSPEPPPSDAARQAAENDAAKAKVEQCKAAQDRYQQYVNSRRLYRDLPGGKREYLTDKELSDARARAKQSVDDYCN